ncbi:peptidoglycan binding protein, partial [Listeria ivanovii FSL F6-596]
VTPEEPVTPLTVLPEASVPNKVIKEESIMTKLPKTGDTPLYNGLGLLLVALSTGSLVLFRKK